MKKLLLLLLVPFGFYAQVGVNTSTPHSSSMMEINSTDKGLLIPRISIPNLNAAAPVAAPATSLLVYNTNATTGIGYYYWDSAKWVPLASTDDWDKTGNNIYNNNSGYVGIGTTSPTTKLHVESIGSASTLLNQTFETNSIAPLTTSGNANWITQTAVVQAGTYAAANGDINDSQSSTLTATVNVTNPSTVLSFYYNVSSETNYDYLRFYINGVQQAQWSGNIGWTVYTATLGLGVNTLTWTYSKDSSFSSGTDTAYLDGIIVTEPAPAALRVVDGNQATGKVLVSDATGNAKWQTLSTTSISNMPDMLSIQGLTIPICNSVNVGTTGSQVVDVRGVNTTVTWTILAKQVATSTATASGNTFALGPIQAERLQVRYDFSPALPVNPRSIIFSANNNTGMPDVFVLNYANKSASSVTINIGRQDYLAGFTNSPCWQGQFYFDLFMTN